TGAGILGASRQAGDSSRIMKILSAIFAVTTALAPAGGQTPDSTIHPDFRLQELRMPAKYKTMGLAFLGDGTLVLAATEEISEKIGMGDMPKPSVENRIYLVQGLSTDTLPRLVKVVAHSWSQVSGVT